MNRVLLLVFNITVSQVQNNHESYSGDYDAIALVVGANNLGSYAVRDAVTAIKETLETLSSLNPRASTFACEVGFLLASSTRMC